MKNTMKKKWIIILVAIILLGVSLFVGLTYSPEKKAVGDWELSGTFEDFELKYGNFGEYKYFNISLWESGGASISSYPTFTSALGSATEMATYYLTEEKNWQYDYLIKLYMANESNELEYYTARLLYNSKQDELMFFTSLDDGLLFRRTNELTTVEITTTEANIQSYMGRYGTGEYNHYEDFYEGELDIINITDSTIIFNVNHYRLWGEDDVIAIKNKQGYYYFEFIHTLVCGYILFEDNNVIIDITKAGADYIPLGKITYHKVQNKNQTETTQNREENIQNFKSSCEKYISSKDLVRYEQEYLNRNFYFVGQVLVVEDNGNSYVIRTDENYDGVYGDNWIYVTDCRENDKTKILESDVIEIYGTFTDVRDNYPCIELYFADIRGL